MPCTTLDANPAPARTLTCAAGAAIPTTPDIDTAAAASSRYIVYRIEELASGRHYVGLTRRPLDARITSHLRQSRRRGRVRPGGLMEALRLMDALGQAIEDCFGVRVLGRADTAQEARDLERHWVTMLDSRVPHGLNGMPGGSSIGGVDNARALHVAWPEGVQAYPSIQAALAEVNRVRSAAGQSPLEVNTLYARLAGGWPVSQALGLEARQDPRKTRAPFQFGADTYTTLEAAAAATGLGVDASVEAASRWPFRSRRRATNRARPAVACTGPDRALVHPLAGHRRTPYGCGIRGAHRRFEGNGHAPVAPCSRRVAQGHQSLSRSSARVPDGAGGRQTRRRGSDVGAAGRFGGRKSTPCSLRAGQSGRLGLLAAASSCPVRGHAVRSGCPSKSHPE